MTTLGRGRTISASTLRIASPNASSSLLVHRFAEWRGDRFQLSHQSELGRSIPL